MYNVFENKQVDIAVCVGDFFDKPRVEARSIKLVSELLSYPGLSDIPTYFLLGNHEIESSDANILDILGSFNLCMPVTKLTVKDELVFVPYDTKLEDIRSTDMHNKIVFTHCDIAGSRLSGDRISDFGYDKKLFEESQMVFNGHIHIASQLNDKFYNVGSLVVNHYGDMRAMTYPKFYTYDTEANHLVGYDNKYSMIFVDTDVPNLVNVLGYYKDNKYVNIKLSYSDKDDITTLESMLKSANVEYSLKKILSSKLEETDGSIETATTYDINQVLSEYINKDKELSDSAKLRIKSLGIKILSEQGGTI